MRSNTDLLHDIVGAAEEIEEYLRGCDVEDFLGDTMRQRAVERMLIIIGEAAKRLSEETRAAIDQPWREIMRLRDKGVHAYEALRPATIFAIASESVGRLREAVEEHLAGA